MSRLGLGIVLAAAVVACLPPAGTLFHTTLTTPDGLSPLPVTLGDQTNLVVGFEPGPIDPFADAHGNVRSDPADPKAIILAWIGGACENQSVVVFHPSGGRYDLAVSHRFGPFVSCPGIGIPRAVRIRTSEPVAIDLIDVIGGPDASANR